MKVTKLGHCALVLEIDGANPSDSSGRVRLLTDPGNWTIEVQSKLKGLDAILITHEHQDHYHLESVKALLSNNPGVPIVANASMTALLAKDIPDAKVITVGDKQSTEVKGVSIEGFGKEHAEIYEQFGLVENTGYFVGDKFYFPGDAFYNPGKKVDVLALPVAGPWMQLKHAIHCAKDISPRAAFGVHDGMILPDFRGFVGMLFKHIVPNVEYVALQDGETREF